ncbi:hypothetical protein AB4Y36_35890 [Paraburkholderia sp. BR10936]|uniref:hypothetical protein n=1 Tax=Paraburkholderia sp. BR10936 TaxID=3236993 RepID=UPI0034D2CB33
MGISREACGKPVTDDALPLNKPTLKELRDSWRMVPLEELPLPRHLTLSTRVWMGVLRTYLIVAVGLVIVKVVQMAIH